MAVQFPYIKNSISNKPLDWDSVVNFNKESGWKGAVYVLRPVVDKVSIVCQVPGHLHAMMAEKFKSALKEGHDFFIGQHPGAQYVLAGNIGLPGGKGRMLVHMQPKHSAAKTAFLRVEVNPSKFTNWAFYLDTILQSLSGGGLEPDVVRKKGKCTRIDVAVDILNARMSDLLIDFLPGVKPYKRTIFVGLDGETETIYPDWNAGNSTTKMYDKGRQLAQSKPPQAQVYGNVPHVRIERHLSKQTPVTELATMANPFLPLVVRHLSLPKTHSDSAHVWKFFTARCQLAGSHSALASIESEHERLVYAEALVEADSGVWEPAKIWEHWGKALVNANLMD